MTSLQTQVRLYIYHQFIIEFLIKLSSIRSTSWKWKKYDLNMRYSFFFFFLNCSSARCDNIRRTCVTFQKWHRKDKFTAYPNAAKNPRKKLHDSYYNNTIFRSRERNVTSIHIDSSFENWAGSLFRLAQRPSHSLEHHIDIYILYLLDKKIQWCCFRIPVTFLYISSFFSFSNTDYFA